MSVEILVKKDFTKKEVLKAQESSGKKRGLTAGSWISDLCALRKVITLCPLCTHKFNPGRFGYIQEKEFPVVHATCDGCKTFDTKCKAYFWEETYKTVRSTAADRRAANVAYRKQQARLMG